MIVFPASYSVLLFSILENFYSFEYQMRYSRIAEYNKSHTFESFQTKHLWFQNSLNPTRVSTFFNNRLNVKFVILNICFILFHSVTCRFYCQNDYKHAFYYIIKEQLKLSKSILYLFFWFFYCNFLAFQILQKFKINLYLLTAWQYICMHKAC